MDTLHQKVTALVIAVICLVTPARDARGMSILFGGFDITSVSVAQSTPFHAIETSIPLVFELSRAASVQLRPELIPICACESNGSKYAAPRHYNADGSVLRGTVTPDDIGMCQINTFFHGERAKNMGLDLFTIEGNILYANDLYERQGTRPWKASKLCWFDLSGQVLTLR